MSHQEAAALWLRLQEAGDLEHILRECVADIAMISIQPNVPISDLRLSSIILCKFILDYQRVYTNTTSRYLDSIQFRSIAPMTLLDVLCCLSAAAREVAPRVVDDKHSEQVLVYLRQAFLAGLRAISLNPPTTSSESIHAADAIYWLRDSWATLDIDQRVTQRLTASTAEQIKHHGIGQNTDLNADDEFVLEKADRHPSQFLLDTKKVVISKLGSLPEVAGNTKYLSNIISLWSDCRLALIHASFQFLIKDDNQDRRESLTTSEAASKTVETLKSLFREYEVCAKTLPEQLRKDIDEIEPMPHCHQCDCGCFPTDEVSCLERCNILSTRLSDLSERLDIRKLSTFNSSADLNDLTTFITTRRDDFETNNPEDDSYSSVYESSAEKTEQMSLKATYMLNCPKMHCVSGNTLRAWIKRHTATRQGLDELSRESELVKTYVQNCPICHQIRDDRTKSTISLARKITPLSQICEKVFLLQNKALKFQSSHSDSNTIAEEAHALDESSESYQQTAEPPALPARTRSDFESYKAAGTGTGTSVQSSKRAKRTSTNLSQATTSSTSTSFLTMLTPDGRHVFVWRKSIVAVLNMADENWITQWQCSSDIRKISASNSLFAAMVNTATGSRIYVQSVFGGTQIMPPVELTRTAKSMCLSPDGTKLLVSSGDHVDYICIASHQICPLPMTGIQPEQIESQCVSFAIGGERALLITRFMEHGHVYITIFDTTDARKLLRIVNLSIGRLIPINNIRDYGVVQCPCYFDDQDKTTTWIICSATERGTQHMMQYKETDKKPAENIKQIDIIGRGKDAIGPAIIQAICLSASCHFLLIDDLNNLYVVQKKDRAAQWASSRLTLKQNIRSSVASMRHRVAVAANSAQQICITTVYKGKVRQIVYGGQSSSDDNQLKEYAIELKHE